MSIIWNFNDNKGIGLVPGFPPKGTKLMADKIDVSQFRLSTKYLLGYQTSAKIVKNDRNSYILYLAPATYSFSVAQLRGRDGKMINTCPDASPECIATCLNISGRSEIEIFTSLKEGKNVRTFEGVGNILRARIGRTALLYWYPDLFYGKIADELKAAAKEHGSEPIAVRMNGTSDIDFITEMSRRGMLKNLPSNFVFYDYTKDPLRAGKFTLPSGHMYVVTFSRSETNTPMAINMLERGNLVAVVFREIPKKWYGFDVIDGDLADDLMIDLAEGKYIEKEKYVAGKDKKGKPIYEKRPTGNVYNFNWGKQKGYVLGLTAKGSLKKYKSKKGAKGFVIDCDNLKDCRVGL